MQNNVKIIDYLMGFTFIFDSVNLSACLFSIARSKLSYIFSCIQKWYPDSGPSYTSLIMSGAQVWIGLTGVPVEWLGKTNRQTDKTENITFVTPFVGGKMALRNSYRPL